MFTTVPAVRILPMDSDAEFDGRNIEDVQQSFFLKELLGPERRPGKYWYHKRGLKADRGTMVLFQYHGKLIASASFLEAIPFPQPEQRAKGTYLGALYFDANSIRIFDPIGPQVVAAIWPKFTSFSRVKWNLDPKGLAEFERKLTGIERPSRQKLPAEVET